MSDEVRPVLLIIADISGYTRFMTANAKTLAHAQLIITQLMENILHGIGHPVVVSKLEGDAVFFYSFTDTEAWATVDVRTKLSQQLMDIHSTFESQVSHLIQSQSCICPACVHIGELRLKIVVHAGTALLHTIGQYQEIAGADVILVHRLLKNQVQADHYVLVTEQALKHLSLPSDLEWRHTSESYEGFNAVRTQVYVPLQEQQRTAELQCIAPLKTRMSASMGMFLRLTLQSQPLIWGLRQLPNFSHIPQAASPASRLAQTLGLLLTLPLVLGIGIPWVIGREILRGTSRSNP